MSALPKILRHSSPDEPGFSRRRRGKGFSYHAPDGSLLRRQSELTRIKALGLPPAYSNVWICADAFGHLQAVGQDDRQRRQYRYHAEWRAFRDRLKYDRLEDFGRALPRLRARVDEDLRRNRADKAMVTAALVRLIDRGALRIGNSVYSEQNNSFGASTLRSRHLTLDGSKLRLAFRAKGGKRVRKQITDRTLSRVLSRIDDLPGAALFTYQTEDDDVRRVKSDDVNRYIAEAMACEAFTAKTFRTFHGSVAALDYAFQTTQTEGAALTIKAMSEAASERLHNTPAIARSSYIHPDIIALSETETAQAVETLSGIDLRRAPNDLPTEEKRLVSLLAD